MYGRGVIVWSPSASGPRLSNQTLASRAMGTAEGVQKTLKAQYLFGETPNRATGTVALPFSDCFVPSKPATFFQVDAAPERSRRRHAAKSMTRTSTTTRTKGWFMDRPSENARPPVRLQL